ncbi:MAG: NAD(P)/FAD-dependent oxidoreductase [Rubripirellula sp.]
MTRFPVSLFATDGHTARKETWTMQSDVLIVGAGVNGNLTARYLKQQQPDLDIVVLDKGQSNLPLVGESLTEYSTHFLRQLGFGDHLEEKHYHKYGLTFYFKDRLDDPQDRTYSVHEAPAIPPMQSALINRYVFDQELRQRNEAAGITYRQASASSIRGVQDGFAVTAKRSSETGSSSDEIRAKWVVDCSGRSRFLVKQLGLQAPLSTPQRCSYWFRLVDFDQERLNDLIAIKEGQSAFDSYYTTHHFMGDGNWAWCIPMRPHDDHKNLISIGVVWRPDLKDPEIKSVESFVEYFREEHPVISELVESGTYLDHGLYRNYMYQSSHVYSPQGWFLIGDAADTVDPLYSTGLVLSSLQITQVEKMIAEDKAGRLTTETVQDFESAYQNTWSMMQSEISGAYEVVHGPWQSHWRMYISSLVYFHLMLPAWLAGYMVDPKGARWITQFLSISRQNTNSLARILMLSDGHPKNGSARDLPNRYAETINWKLWRGDEMQMHRHLSVMLRRLAKYRFLFWRRSGFQEPVRQGFAITKELGGSLLFGTLLRWTKPHRLARAKRLKMPLPPEVPSKDLLPINASPPEVASRSPAKTKAS